MIRSLRITAILIIIAGLSLQSSEAQSGGLLKKKIDIRTIPFTIVNPDSSTGFGNRPSINEPLKIDNGPANLKEKTGDKTDDTPIIVLPPVALRYAISESSGRGQSQRTGNANFADKAYQFFGQCFNMSLRYKYPSLSAPKGASTNVTGPGR